MNTVLIVCSRCLQVQGCTLPKKKLCRSCTSHDCPFLPAPTHAEGCCEACRGKEAKEGRHPTLLDTQDAVSLTAQI